MGIWAYLLVWASLTFGGIAQVTKGNGSAAARPRLLMPDEDPFYKPPRGWESKPVGSILASRKVPNPLTLDNNYRNTLAVKNAWQLLYRTQNSVGEPEATITTLLEPFNAKRNKLFVYHFFSNACFSHCNPSVTIQRGARKDNEYNQQQSFVTILALQRGWYVSIADDIGPQAALGSGLQAGYAMLDSIRAVKRSSNMTRVDSNATIVSYGYSGGAFSSGFTLELQPTYAPDVRIAGAALGGIMANLTHIVDLHNKKDRAGFGPPTWIGLSRDFKNFSTWLTENLVPQYEPKFRLAERQCFNANWYTYEYEDLGKYFKRGYASLKDEIPMSVYHNVGEMGKRATPKVPLYIYESAGDDASPVELVDSLYNKWCQSGASILYQKNPDITVKHSPEMVAGFPGALRWIEGIMAGKPTDTGCKQVERYITVSDSNAIFLQGLVQELSAYLGLPLGPTRGIRTSHAESAADAVIRLEAKWLELANKLLPKSQRVLTRSEIKRSAAAQNDVDIPMLTILPSPTFEEIPEVSLPTDKR